MPSNQSYLDPAANSSRNNIASALMGVSNPPPQTQMPQGMGGGMPQQGMPPMPPPQMPPPGPPPIPQQGTPNPMITPPGAPSIGQPIPQAAPMQLPIPPRTPPMPQQGAPGGMGLMPPQGMPPPQGQRY